MFKAKLGGIFFSVACAALMLSTHVNSQEIESSLFTISISQEKPTTNSSLSLDFVGDSCFSIIPNALRIDTQAKTAHYSYRINFVGDLGGPCLFSSMQTAPLGVLPDPGMYLISLYEEYDSSGSTPDYFLMENLVGAIDLEIQDFERVATPETPQEGSIHSGVGLIRGWACDASSVLIQFDDLEPFDVAYGAPRADTLGICGDESNGYGAVFAWGLLGKGTHRMRTWVNGFLVDDINFEVAGLDDPFAKELSGEYVLKGFPGPSDSVTVRWSEPDQNFIIISD